MSIYTVYPMLKSLNQLNLGSDCDYGDNIWVLIVTIAMHFKINVLFVLVFE